MRLVDREGRLCANAQSLHIAAADIGEVPTASLEPPDLEGAKPAGFPVTRVPHDLHYFGSEAEARYPPGEDNLPGPTTLWMRARPILDGEDASPFQSLCPLADCGNGISRNTEIDVYSCVNPDLTILVHRLPESEWLAARCISFWESNGIGSSHATLFDERGAIGTAIQSLVIRPVV